MIRTPLCGTCEASTGTVTIFVGNDTCFGSVVFTNCGTGTVDILKNGSTTALATLSAGCRLALALDSLCKLELQFTTDSTVTYRGCVCCNDNQCCEPICEIS